MWECLGNKTREMDLKVQFTNILIHAFKTHIYIIGYWYIFVANAVEFVGELPITEVQQIHFSIYPNKK